MSKVLIPEYESLIFQFRGMKVMVDSDLALLYDVPTKALKQQIKRNIARFPEDFMFKLSKVEKDEPVTNCDRLSNLKHSSVMPLVFTEQGVSMLRSEKAIQINIEIMRSFARYRALIRENSELKKEINKLDKKLNQAFKFLLEKIDVLHQKESKPLNPIGFKPVKK